MNIKKLPTKMIAMIALSSVFLVACDDTRVRVSASNNYHVGGHHHLSHTPHNHRIRYDSALGLYALVGLSNVFWDNGRYYRYHNNGWQYSLTTAAGLVRHSAMCPTACISATIAHRFMTVAG